MLFITMFWLSTAVAQATDIPSTTGEDVSALASGGSKSHAEYVRLSQELETLSTRNAWPGVERTYEMLVATGVTPTFEDYVFGAHGARALGDITQAQARLRAANGIREDKQVIDWLWEIDSSYGLVYLAGDVGGPGLRADVMPFEPDQAHAVEFAVARIAETGVFEGYLPQGTYHFGDYEVKVQPRVQATRIDLRTDTGAKPPKGKKKLKG